jgi:hypothetical protein
MFEPIACCAVPVLSEEGTVGILVMTVATSGVTELKMCLLGTQCYITSRVVHQGL